MATQTSKKSTQAPEKRAAQPAASAQRNGDAQPTNEQIARRAYEIYQARGGTDGRDQDDWFRAEQELKLGRQ